MYSLITMQLAVSGGVWESGITRFGVRTYREIICLTTAGAVANGFLAMGGFVRGTGGRTFRPPANDLFLRVCRGPGRG